MVLSFSRYNTSVEFNYQESMLNLSSFTVLSVNNACLNDNVGPGMMDQLVKCLPCQREELSKDKEQTNPGSSVI